MSGLSSFSPALSDEELRVAAQALYDKNLSMLVEKAKLKRSMWRVSMDDAGVITGLHKCRPGKVKPEKDSFILIVTGDQKMPRFGSLAGLSGYQVRVAKVLEKDLAKLFDANQIAYCLSKSPKLKSVQANANGQTIEKQIKTYSKRFGQLPKSAAQLEDETEEIRRMNLRNREIEKQNLLNQHTLSFEEVLAQERRKIEKRERRQKLKERIRRVRISPGTASDSEEDDIDEQEEEKQSDDASFKENKYFKYFYRLNNQRYQYIYIYS